MRRIIAASLVLAVLAVGVLGTGTPAFAGAATDVALGLAAFAVFNQIVAPFIRPYPAYAYYPRAVVYPVVQPVPVVYYQPPVVYQTPIVYQSPVVYQSAPAPAGSHVVHYPHGRYELHVQAGQYVWVWIPNAPPQPVAPPATTP